MDRISKKEQNRANQHCELDSAFDFYHFLSLRIKKHKTLRKTLLKIANKIGIKSISQKYEDEMKNNQYK